MANEKPAYCQGCKFFSEMMARSANGTFEAMCLNDKSPCFQVYVGANDWCSLHQPGNPVDAPQRDKSGYYEPEQLGYGDE